MSGWKKHLNSDIVIQLKNTEDFTAVNRTKLEYRIEEAIDGNVTVKLRRPDGNTSTHHFHMKDYPIPNFAQDLFYRKIERSLQSQGVMPYTPEQK